MTQMIPHIINGTGTISLMIDGKMRPIDTAHKFYAQIQAAVKAKDWGVIPGLVNIAQHVEKAINASTTASLIKIVDGEVFYDGTVIHNTLTNRIVNMARDGFDVGYMVKFLENLMENPSYRAVQELYDFLEAGAIPITDNGTFLGYKKIASTWKDIYSGTMDNSLGAVVKMPRNMVNEDSSVTCSKGLHVCSYDYLSYYGSCGDDRVVIVEVNPRDVVSIPKDYNNTKMRVCQYTVVSEVEDYKANDPLSKQSVFTLKPEPVADDPVADDPVVENAGKPVGKRVSAALDAGEVTIDQVRNASIVGGLNHFTSHGLFAIGISGTKQVGKQIARFINKGLLNADAFVNALFKPVVEPAFNPNDVSFEDAKNLGKRVTQGLDYKEFLPDQLGSAAIKAGLNSDQGCELANIARRDTKWAGKKVTRYLLDEEMNMLEFEAALFTLVNTAKTDKECENCDPCTCTPDAGTTTVTRCHRCGHNTVKSTGQCSICHFWH
jgi:hypothetical protein